MRTKLTLYQMRINLGKSIKEVSNATGVSESTIRRYEKDATKSDSAYFYRLCKYYGVHPEHVYYGYTVNGEIPVSNEEQSRKFSRKAVWMAMDSEHGDRLQEIAVERIRLTRKVSDYRKMGQREVSEMLYRINELDAERDELIKPFQQQLDDEAQQQNAKLTVDLKKVFERLEEAGHDMSGAYEIINSSLKCKKTTTATTFGEEAEVI